MEDINKYKKNAVNLKIIKIIDIFIAIIACFFIIYVFVINQDILLKTIIGIIIVVLASLYGIFNFEAKETMSVNENTKINKLVLINNKGIEIDEWLIDDQTSMLIGKSSTDKNVDIDLSGIEYEALINYEHAVLNNVLGMWYIEDIDSVNGIGLKKAHKFKKMKLKYETPYRLGKGDTIYIANTRLLVK